MADWLIDTPIAHRGLHDGQGGVPENSLAAFRRAMSRGYGVELDVRLTRDHQVAVMHDETLARMTGDPRRVDEVDASELLSLRLTGTAEPVPLFESVLDVLHGAVGLLVEVKNEGSAGPLEAAVVKCLAAYNGPVAVQTFHPGSLTDLSRRLPRTRRGFLFGPRSSIAGVAPGDGWLRAVRDVLGGGAADFAGCDVRGLPYEPVPGLRARMPVLGWTVRSDDEALRARRWCDNLIFEGFLPD